MKSLFLFLITFLFLQFTSSAQEGWFWQNPLPQGNKLNDVAVIDANTIITAGEAGLILKTTNAGMEWVKKESTTTEDIIFIKFTDENTGWALSEGELLGTIDQGENWEVAFSDTLINTWTAAYFLNRDTGWISGKCPEPQPLGAAVLYKTTNAGTTWEMQDTRVRFRYNDIFFLNGNYGWIVASRFLDNYGYILKTTDGGENWTELQFWDPGIMDAGWNSILFTDENTGWLTRGEYPLLGLWWGVVLKTTNGGFNWDWSLDLLSETALGYDKVYFADSNNGWVIGGEEYLGEILWTTNGGDDWNRDFWESADMLHSVSFHNNAGCIVGSAGSVYRTTDGTNWSEITSAVTKHNIYSLDFIDQNRGWAVSNSWSDYSEHTAEPRGTVIGTTNGGSNWTKLFSTDSVLYYSIEFINSDTGWIAGGHHTYPEGGVILRTTDGGTLWQTQLNASAKLNDVFFVNDQVGYAAGEEDLLKSTDGGNNWFYPSFSIEGAKSIFFINENIGWIVGTYGIYPTYDFISKTTDGGVNWVLQSDTVGRPGSVYFVNSDTGWVVGGHPDYNYAGNIIKTTNGGETWLPQLTDPSLVFNSVYFSDINSGWVTGLKLENDAIRRGIILKTTNGGNDWTEQENQNQNLLNDVFFVNNNIGWVVGDGGTILHTSNGGVSFIEEQKSDVAPNKFILTQNYPNPFNPLTKIKYSIPEASNVVIKVYDILGNEIETLVNEKKPAGTYELTWSAKGLPSGVYFYQLRAMPVGGQAGYYVKTKKMLLLK